jgi:hypothetical protein
VWVAVRLRDDPIANGVVEPVRHRGSEQRASVRIAKRPDRQLGQTGQLRELDGLASREDDHDGLRGETARDEAEDLGGRPIQPLRIVQQADERLMLRGIREQCQDRKPHKEPIRRFARNEAEGRSESVALGSRQVVEPTQQWRAQLV